MTTQLDEDETNDLLDLAVEEEDRGNTERAELLRRVVGEVVG